MDNAHTQQEDFWLGEFGKEYTERNTPQTMEEWGNWYQEHWGMLKQDMNAAFLGDLPRNSRILEVGCNSGNQLIALQEAGFTDIYGVELQPFAADAARKRTTNINILCGSGFDLPFRDAWFDVVCTNGVLIHISPNDLPRIMDEMYRTSRKYIWGFEYYAEKVTDINYRGNSGFLWKADYAALFMERFPDLKLVKKQLYPYVKPGMEQNADCMYLLEKTR
jgi:pseudaminic acid biosynthesis-associated methylase